MTEMEPFHQTQVKTRNVVVDLLQRARNLLGYRLRGYEDMVKDGTDDILEDLQKKYDIDWYRVDVDQLGPGSMLITVYGMGEPLEDAGGDGKWDG